MHGESSPNNYQKKFQRSTVPQVWMRTESFEL